MSRKPNHQSATQPCDWLIEQLPGLSVQDQSKLQELGITTTRQLLQIASTPQSRQALANQLQIKSQYVNKWVALADLARIPGIGYQHCGLLLHAGICSATQLAQTPAHRLYQQILRLQVATMQRRDLCPQVDEVAKWVKQARELAVVKSFECVRFEFWIKYNFKTHNVSWRQREAVVSLSIP